MDFAADAVVEVVTPTRQPARAPADRSGPSFEDHLNAANAEQSASDTERTPRLEANAEQNAENTETVNDSDETIEATPSVTQPAPPQVATIVLQLMGADAPIATPPQKQPADLNAAPPTLPVQNDTAKAAPPAPPTIPTAAKADVSAAAESANASDKAPPSPEKIASAVPETQPQQQQAAQSAPAPQAVVAPQPNQTASAQTPPAPSSTTPAIAVQAAAPSAPRPAAPPTQHSGKADAPGNSKADLAAAKAAEHAVQKPQGGGAPNTTAPAIEAPVQAAAAADQNTAQAQSHLQAAATTSTAAAHTQHAVLDQSAARAAPAASQVAREIVRRFDGETTRFELRLDPPELGRVEVRLEVSRDHRVTATVAADSPQALTELARHARDLEQALQSAGLELTDNGLSFDLRQSRDDDADGGNGGQENASDTEALTETPASARPIGFERWRGVRVDLMI